MRTFRDETGREWAVRVDVDAIRRVRAAAGVDLNKLPAEKMRPLADLLEDPVRVCDVLYVVCRREADERGVTDEDFGRALAGDCYDAAAEALVQAVYDFFPPRRGTLLRRVTTEMKKAQAAIERHAAAELDKLERMTDQERAAAWTLKPSAGGSPGSSGPTPDPTPSANST